MTNVNWLFVRECWYYPKDLECVDSFWREIKLVDENRGKSVGTEKKQM